MSYDLLVFEPSAAPRERDEFFAWWDEQSQWPETHGYGDPGVTSPKLRAWYEAVAREFPDLNGPGVSDQDIGERHTEYTIGTKLIYGSFNWAEAEEAYELVRRLAVEHEVGFFDASGDEGDIEIHFPGDTLKPPSQGAWRRISAEFRELRDRE